MLGKRKGEALRGRGSRNVYIWQNAGGLFFARAETGLQGRRNPQAVSAGSGAGIRGGEARHLPSGGERIALERHPPLIVVFRRAVLFAEPPPEVIPAQKHINFRKV